MPRYGLGLTPPVIAALCSRHLLTYWAPRWLGCFAARVQITVVVIGRGGRSAPQVLKRPVPGHHSGPHVEVFHLETNQVR